MQKDPAFLFYSGDFLSGVQDLTMEERGQYITLLCLQHQKGRLTEKMIQLACHGNAAADVLAKFRHMPDGTYSNERLEEEMQKRRAASEIARQKALKRWNSGNSNATADAAAYTPADAQHMHFIENENEIQPTTSRGVLGGELSELEIGMTIEYIAITGQRRLTAAQVVEYWKAYLIHSQGEYHPGRNKQLQHFRNWLKKQPHATADTKNGAGHLGKKSGGAAILTAKLAADIEAINAGGAAGGRD